MQITVAHSPDSDDAFMFYGLASGRVADPALSFAHVLVDIETLNHAAQRGVYEVTALSVHAYPHVAERYALMTCGGSIGDGYGPLVVARERLDLAALAGRTVAVPGTLTTAVLALRLALPDLEHRVVPFDQIPEAVASGQAELGLLIHEGQLTYEKLGLVSLLDLGAWWKRETGLPLPLGANAVRRDLGVERMRRLTRLVHDSVRYGLDHRDEALAYALSFGRGMVTSVADRFVGLWVNDRTLDCGVDGRRAIQLLLDRGHAAGLIPRQVEVDFVEP
jgi:1,4-dihydroxy-6-naphthoate synthase